MSRRLGTLTRILIAVVVVVVPLALLMLADDAGLLGYTNRVFAPGLDASP